MASLLTSNGTRSIEELLVADELQTAFKYFESHVDEINDEHIRICSIPAPPFGEGPRAEFLCTKFTEIGLTDAQLDDEGNCLAFRKGSVQSPLVVVSAHLDTVFPIETDFTVHRIDGKLLAPGISDDGCGLAALIALARSLERAKIQTEGSILFVGTVGEEGEGNLRGVRHLLTAGKWANRIDAFVSFDGPGIDRITNAALGSRRYRVSLRGTGGHSWGDFGMANPVHALGRAISKLASYPAPREPRTTFNVGRIEGGTGVNAIACEAVMDVDLRSVSEDELLRLDAFFRRAVREALDDENAGRRKGDRPLELSVKLLGERPSGETPPGSSIVKLAQDATGALGFTARLDRASTDANIPISLGIPAITLGAGGTSGSSHTVDEWYDPSGRDLGLKRALLVLLGMVGLRRDRTGNAGAGGVVK
jgi:tripeptide aminopeptidase